jgi:hypothetical protein
MTDDDEFSRRESWRPSARDRDDHSRAATDGQRGLGRVVGLDCIRIGHGRPTQVRRGSKAGRSARGGSGSGRSPPRSLCPGTGSRRPPACAGFRASRRQGRRRALNGFADNYPRACPRLLSRCDSLTSQLAAAPSCPRGRTAARSISAFGRGDRADQHCVGTQRARPPLSPGLGDAPNLVASCWSPAKIARRRRR